MNLLRKLNPLTIPDRVFQRAARALCLDLADAELRRQVVLFRRQRVGAA